MTSITNSSLSSSLLQQMQQARQSLFQKADADGNGGLSLEEFKAAGPKDAQGNAIAPPSGAPSVEDMFASLDSDGDGSLTQSEMDAGFGKKSGPSQSLLSGDMLTQLLSQLSDEETQSIFESADADGDGSLNEDEFGAAVKSIVTAALGEAPAGGPPAGGPPPGGGGGGGAEAASPTQVYDALDTNQDGTVSLDELLAANDDEEDSSASSILSLLKPSDDEEDSNSVSSTQALRTDFTKFLLSLQEQQYAA